MYLYSHILMPLEMSFLIDGNIVSGESFQLSNTCWLLEENREINRKHAVPLMPIAKLVRSLLQAEQILNN